MGSALAIQPVEPKRFAVSWVSGFSDLVEATGLDEFGARLLSFFDKHIGADHCTIYQSKNYELSKIASADSARLTSMPEFSLSTYEVNRHFRQLGPSDTRVVHYNLPQVNGSSPASSVIPCGILFLGGKPNSLFCVRVLILSPQYDISESTILSLREIAGLIISLVSRHMDLTLAKPNEFSALTSLNTIQQRIEGSKKLSRRETEVCARIIFGYSSCEIASDLGIGKESVMTYRKRAYQHLEICSQRELLFWYLEQGPKLVYN